MSEVDRIVGLPRFAPDAMAQAELAAKWTKALAKVPDARALRPIQGYILETGAMAAEVKGEGLLGNVAVGGGKTLAFLLLPIVFKAERPLLLIPPDMREQLDKDRWEWAQEYVAHPDLKVMAYSELSLPKATDILGNLWGEGLGPDLIMADEVQNLRHESAARTKRFLRYMRQHPGTRFAGMSGTLSTASILDYHHLMTLACPSRTVLPRGEEQAKSWAAVMDPSGEPEHCTLYEMAPLVRGFGDAQWFAPSTTTPEAVGTVRRAYFARFRSAPGCIATEADSCDASLSLSAVYPQLNEPSRQALKALQDDMRLPDGTDVVDELHAIRAAQQLSNGFYYIWDWPGDPDEEWLDARRAWAAAVRWYLKRYADAGRDSPWLVEDYVRKDPDAASTLQEPLADWDAQRQKPAPPVRAIWLDTAPVIHAVRWAKQHDQGFVWFRSRAVGEMLQRFGVTAMWEGTPSRRDQPVVALSERVFHKGRNFQEWSQGLHMEPGANAAIWEQLLGRQHRAGQKAAVHLDVYQHTWPLQVNIARAFQRAQFLQDITGQPQKLLFAEKMGFKKVEVTTAQDTETEEEDE